MGLIKLVRYKNTYNYGKNNNELGCFPLGHFQKQFISFFVCIGNKEIDSQCYNIYKIRKKKKKEKKNS